MTYNGGDEWLSSGNEIEMNGTYNAKDSYVKAYFTHVLLEIEVLNELRIRRIIVF